MNVKQYLDHCSEQNWQVLDQEKKVSSPTKMSTLSESELNSTLNENPVLEARVQSLKHSILVLKNELLEEKALWKKEVELMANLISNTERCPESDLTSEADIDTKSIASLPVPSLNTDPLVSLPLIRDFEEKLSRYQGALAQAQAEKRFNIRRQIVANTYRKRLNEVEKLCQEELNKVRETATHLEPLKQMASEWNNKSLNRDLINSQIDKTRKPPLNNADCSGDYVSAKGRETQTHDDSQNPYEVPVKQIDASLVMDEDASNEIKGKIVLQIGSLPSEVPTICYSAKFE